MVCHQKIMTGWNHSSPEHVFGDANIFLEDADTARFPGAVSQHWVPRKIHGPLQNKAGWQPRMLRAKQDLRISLLLFLEYDYLKISIPWKMLLSARSFLPLLPFKYYTKWWHHLESVNICSVQSCFLQKEVRIYCSFFYKHIAFVLSWVYFSLGAQSV